LRYGIYRLPSGIFAAGLFFIPVVAASSSISLKTAAYMGIIAAIFGFLQTVAYPFNLILLPKFSEYQSRNENEITKTNSQTVLDFIVTFPLLAGIFLFFLSDELILIWFGIKYAQVSIYLKFLSPTVGLYMAYVLIRGILDGLYEFPYSNIINITGVIIVGVLSYLSVIFEWNLWGLSLSFGLCIISIGISSIYILWRRQQLVLFNQRNLLSLLWFFAVFSLIFIYSINIKIPDLWYSFSVKIVISCVFILASFYFYRFLKYDWIKNIKIDRI
jgi:O-antigen/teichoic acid export membrane protein